MRRRNRLANVVADEGGNKMVRRTHRKRRQVQLEVLPLAVGYSAPQLETMNYWYELRRREKEWIHQMMWVRRVQNPHLTSPNQEKDVVGVDAMKITQPSLKVPKTASIEDPQQDVEYSGPRLEMANFWFGRHQQGKKWIQLTTRIMEQRL